jgi:hypothetical protein
MARILGWTMNEVRQHDGWDLVAMLAALEDEQRARRRAERRR